MMRIYKIYQSLDSQYLRSSRFKYYRLDAFLFFSAVHVWFILNYTTSIN